MRGDFMTDTRKYEYEVRTFNFPDAKVTVRIPIRTPEEWEKQKAVIAKAAANLMRG
jgi:hypothetical protein